MRGSNGMCTARKWVSGSSLKIEPDSAAVAESTGPKLRLAYWSTPVAASVRVLESCAAESAAVAVSAPAFVVAFSDVPDILVNIQSSDGTPAYLKLSLSLEMDNELEKTGMTALMPRLVDQFQSYLRELRVEDLKGSEGPLRLKEELLRRVNAAAAPYKVRDVLLKQMIVQ